MIVFKGEITGKCKDYIKRKTLIASLIAIPIMFLLLSIPIILLAVIFSYYIFLGLILTFILAFCNHLKEFGQYPYCVEIDDYVMKSFNDKIKLEVALEDVLVVYDMGTWYTFKFDLKMNNFFVCQKDLLVEGTLEEFEKLFEGKIERKVKS